MRGPEDAGAAHDAVHRVAARLRVPAFTCASLALATAAHLVGGGMLPATGPLLAGALLVTVAGLALAVRERGLPMIAGTVLVCQAVLHVLWEPGTPAGVLPPGHGWHTAAGSTGAVPVPGASMVVAHLLAALLVALWLRVGEAALWRSVRRVLARIRCAAGACVPLRACATGCDHLVVVLHDLGCKHPPAWLRGPPVTV